jgi:glycerol uptake facilitator-like aquaporin
MTYRWLLSINGRHATPTIGAVLFSLGAEVACTALLTSIVVLVRWSNPASTSAFSVAIVYAIALLACMHKTWTSDHSLRRHLNGAISLAYFFTNDIGLFGLFLYKCAQTLGALVAGGILSALLKDSYTPGQLPVPFPRTTDSSYITAICLEIFISATIVCVYLIAEYLNTKLVTKQGKNKEPKNYHKATMVMAGLFFLAVMIFYQFNAFTWNDNVYLAGLLSGFGKTTPELTIANVAQLNPSSHVLSVFTDGRAWVLYYFAPWAGGALAAGVFWALFLAWGVASSNEALASKSMIKTRVESQYHEKDHALASEETLGALINPLSRT